MICLLLGTDKFCIWRTGFTSSLGFSCTSETQLFHQSRYSPNVQQLSLCSLLSFFIFRGSVGKLHFPTELLKGTTWSRDAASPRHHLSLSIPRGLFAFAQLCVPVNPWGTVSLSSGSCDQWLAGRSPGVQEVSQSYHTGQNVCPVFLNQLSRLSQYSILSLSSKMFLVPPSSVSPTNSVSASLLHHTLMKTRADRH